jgi:acetyltransferase
MIQRATLSEFDSKALLSGAGVSVSRERLVEAPEQVVAAAEEIGFPVALKLCGNSISHKTERNLLRLNLRDPSGVKSAARELWALHEPEDGEVGLLVSEMVAGNRELIAGVVRDPQFGPCVLVGLGGILAEALGDVVFARAPLDGAEAGRMVQSLAASHLVTKAFRGEAPGDLEAIAAVLVSLGDLALGDSAIESIDVNPLILREGEPVAVDALVVRGGATESDSSGPTAPGLSAEQILERFRPLFHPRGIIVAGASTHPGKFGFVALHNLHRCGYRGEIFAVNREGADILGEPSLRDVSEVPTGKADLVFVCTPAPANVELLRACAKVGVRAAFVASAGYGEAGEDGKVLEDELVATADELGILLAGPNGQGVISTPVAMCAQIVAPYPPSGRISVVSQSGNLVSSFLNYGEQTGVGISKAVSAGNSAQTDIAHYLEYFAEDPETDVVVAYVEGVPDGARFVRALKRLIPRKPLVLLKGGVGSEGQKAALSHTGSLATDDRVFSGVCRQHGVLRAPNVEEAFEWAATLATQPLPGGRRTVVFTTAGGWGVLSADACAEAGLDLMELPDDIRDAVDEMVPARWSRGNPLDLAGGETRDTVTAVLDMLCAHREVDAVIHLGLGIQAATAQLMKSGPFYPDFGLDRMTDFHTQQDRRYAEAAAAASDRHGTPVLSATELVYTDREYGNSGPLALKDAGRVCYPSSHRAVRALRALCDYAEFRRR